MSELSVNILVGKTLSSIVNHDDETIIFTVKDGESYSMTNNDMRYGNDVEVKVEDICGDLNDLVGTEIFQAEVSTNKNKDSRLDGGGTWTFYRFATIKGYVTIRWFGTSNGYYCEEVQFSKMGA